MHLSLNWLKEYVKIPKKITPEELSLILSLHTVEVENARREADKFDKVVVGKILEVKKHLYADRLRIAKVDIKEKILEIVCGASNIAKGQKVPVALPGAVLLNGLKIKEEEVRGVKSAGMLCASDELGLGDDHSGILILEKNAKVGCPLAEYLELADIIFEVDNKSLSNRPDLWCHYGMAREIAALTNSKLKPVSEIVKKEAIAGIEDLNSGIKLAVKVEDQKLCPRYMAVALSGIKVGRSPKWMEKRLAAAGMRPINNIVDITNYVMLELGQPLHAFDASLIKIKEKHEIIVRLAKKGEKIETLDGNQKELPESTLLIANEKWPLAIAGVMGGAESEINEQTFAIIIESANFDSVSIRKTSSQLGLRTESSMRFEKSLDPSLCELALFRTVELIKQACGEAKVASEVMDIKNFLINQNPLELDLGWVAKKIGQKIPVREIIKILNSLGFKVEHSGHKLSAVIPTWRATKDISIPEDIIEEIVRIYGYDKILPLMPKVEVKVPEINKERMLERKIEKILTAAPALIEVYNYSFVGEEQLKKLNMDSAACLRLVNPIASHQMLLRQSLIPNLLVNIKTNQNRFDKIGIFEIGRVFFSSAGDVRKDAREEDLLPYQEKSLGIILAGEKREKMFGKIKGVVEYLLYSLGLTVLYEEMETKPSWIDYNMCGGVLVEGERIGVVGKIDGKIGRSFDLKQEAAAVEISLKQLFNLVEKTQGKKYNTLGKYPSLTRDLAFVINNKILYNEIKEQIAKFNGLIKEVELFDVYEGEKVGRGKKNLAFHLVYRALDRTLTAPEVDDIQKKLIKNLEEKFGAKMRDF